MIASGQRVDMDALDVTSGGYRYTGLRECDIEALRGFRNAQMAVLRQNSEITREEQWSWYSGVVLREHAAAVPELLLVSILESGEFVGYGGLTHIDWENRRAELSFLVDPGRVAEPEVYRRDFASFLEFVKDWSFGPLGLHRLWTETYAFRRHHIAILESAGFEFEGKLVDHVVDPAKPTKFIDSLMHAVLEPKEGR